MSKLAPERCQTILFQHCAYNLCYSFKEQGFSPRGAHAKNFIAYSFPPCFPLTQGYMATRDNAPFGPFVVYEL